MGPRSSKDSAEPPSRVVAAGSSGHQPRVRRRTSEGVTAETARKLAPVPARNLEAPLGRYSSGLHGCRGLHFAQMAGDVVAGEDFAHLRLVLRAAGEGVGTA